MNTFLSMFTIALLFIAVPIGILATINALRKKQPGCSGSHDCVVYKGEKVMCPSCELKELKAEIAAAQQL
ncbi:hypothetical protein P4C99_08645 [Pontiellaceae bacterium B1224]|nr:hypothetical protein [Pontiellaceae bacterium B1224]